jgi:hypothetical protein
MSNVAEGFERGAKSEFIQFLYIAKGSCGEVRAQLRIARDQDYIPARDYDDLHDLARRTSGMLSKFIAHLQKSDYQGEKFTRPARQGTEAQQARVASLRAAHEANTRSEKQHAQARRNQEQRHREENTRRPCGVGTITACTASRSARSQCSSISFSRARWARW